MGRRVEPTKPTDEADAKATARRVRQLELRLRLCVDREGDLWPKIKNATDATKSLMPADRLIALLHLADEIRSVLPKAVAENCLQQGCRGVER